MSKSQRGRSVDSVSRAPSLLAPSLIEQLESRTLLSASLVSGVLKITGTTGDDTITVGLNGAKTKITVQQSGAATKSFTRSAVKSVSILAGNGADNVTINPGIKQVVTI